ncbi:MAG: hypothetical protein QOD84_942 [Acidobacteriaceae bacterium]
MILSLIVCADYIPEDAPTGPEDSATEASSGKQLIFVVEDDSDIGRLICHCLYMHGYATRWFAEPSTLMAQANADFPALILLDIMLPGTDGFELCRQIRQSKTLEECRVIFLSAKTGESERINGLELGADAYITKPFSPRELVARVRTVLRRTPGLEPIRIEKFGRLEIDSLAMTVSVDGKLIKTTTREFRLLDYLVHHPTRVFTRNQLLDAVWSEGAFVTQRSIDVYIRRLRERIEVDPENPKYLLAVRGVGYRFVVPG